MSLFRSFLALIFLPFSDSFSSLKWATVRGNYYCDGGYINVRKCHWPQEVVGGDVMRQAHPRWPRQCSLESLRMSTKSIADDDRVQIAIDKFISTLQTSIENGSFESFTLNGPTAVPRKQRKSSSEINSKDTEKLRGKFKRISGRLVLLHDKKKKSSRNESVHPGRLCVQTTIKYFLATDIVKNWEVCRQLNSDRKDVEQGLRQLFFTAMGLDTNGPLSEWGSQNINADLGILAGILDTSVGVYKLSLYPPQNAMFELAKRKRPQSNAEVSTEVNRLPQLSHDRLKNVALLPSSKFFQKLGVSNADGRPLMGMASKLRQCQKFVEIVGNLALGSTTTSSRIRVIDMGCGRGYLTFSLHSYLSSRFEEVHTQGIDRRPMLINEINGIAQELGGAFATLNLIEGSIESAPKNLFKNDQLPDSNGSLDILIALHACDTATDDALWFAITHDADIIVTAPCCQHELRPQIDRYAATNPDQPLCSILRHAIYRERATETVTDAMRVILLEISGYETNVFEFIGGEHTSKNVMITATKTNNESKGGKWLQARRQRLVDLVQLYGIKHQRLAMLMQESITAGEDKVPKLVTRRSGMAPL